MSHKVPPDLQIIGSPTKIATCSILVARTVSSRMMKRSFPGREEGLESKSAAVEQFADGISIADADDCASAKLEEGGSPPLPAHRGGSSRAQDSKFYWPAR